MNKPEIDPDLIDEAVLALLYLTLHREGGPISVWRAWKSFDWEALRRLHDKEMILDPVGKAKSVMMTTDSRRRGKHGSILSGNLSAPRVTSQWQSTRW